MSYIDDIFTRANLQQLRSFLLDGTETQKVSEEPCEQRLRQGTEGVFRLIQALSPDQSEPLETQLMIALAAYEEVFMEIGLRAGMSLSAQLFRA